MKVSCFFTQLRLLSAESNFTGEQSLWGGHADLFLGLLLSILDLGQALGQKHLSNFCLTRKLDVDLLAPCYCKQKSLGRVVQRCLSGRKQSQNGSALKLTNRRAVGFNT